LDTVIESTGDLSFGNWYKMTMATSSNILL